MTVNLGNSSAQNTGGAGTDAQRPESHRLRLAMCSVAMRATTLVGGAGDDTLAGGAGGDTLSGGDNGHR